MSPDHNLDHLHTRVASGGPSSPRPRYVAQVRPIDDTGFLLIYVPALDRHTQAKGEEEVEPVIRDLIEISTQVDPDSFDLVIERRQAAP
jgi:hypothetical protein